MSKLNPNGLTQELAETARAAVKDASPEAQKAAAARRKAEREAQAKRIERKAGRDG